MTTPTALGKTTIEVFLASADKDVEAAPELWARLGEALKASADVTWHLWGYRDQILAGDDFDEKIRDAVEKSDMGVFAISVAFLNSGYIAKNEFPPFLQPAPGKRIVPVLLKAFPRNADLRGLQTRQIFGFHQPFWAGRAPHRRAEWVNALADEMHRIAHRYGRGS